MRGSVFAVLALALVTALSAARANEPEYPHGGFSGDCTECHSENGWKPTTIGKEWRHPKKFPLVGAHRSAGCRACHVSLDFTEARPDCVGCHTDAHRGELGTDCATCHTPTNFLDRSSQLDKHRATRFPLIGAHAVQDCESCHVPQPQGARTWVGLPIQCVACHRADYDRATDPNHAQARFPLECQLCHTPTFWEKARFDHANTRFPLTGAHRNLDCSACHANGYSGTPTECFACHEADYRGTTDPDHEVLGFPTDCTVCHSTSGWEGAAFGQHDTLYFPIYSGRHSGRWSECSDCHTQAGNFAAFSCFLCHSSGDTDPRHQGVPGYGYDSNLCYQCHPRGEAEDR
jgi:hypothetical protein